MLIQKVKVDNFRCIFKEELDCDRLTVMVGRNGVGKSAFLRALEFFYTPGYNLTEDDFFNRNINIPVSVEVTFTELTGDEREVYAPYVAGDTLTVKRVASWPPVRGSERYYGSRMRCPDFREVRGLTGRERTSAYGELVSAGRFPDLRTGVRRVDDVEAALEEWEERHPQHCERMPDEGQFFGFHNVGAGKLERFTRFVLVPAVRDASEDAAEGRTSALRELLDIVVKSQILKNPELTSFRETAIERYRELLNPANLPELPQLAADLSSVLRRYAPDSEVRLHWQKLGDLQIPLPTAEARLVEDEFEGDISRSGHGLQRAFILTLLQQLASIRDLEVATPAESPRSPEGPSGPDLGDEPAPDSPTFQPHLVLAIEEPELYLHPVRARYFARVLQQLSEPGEDRQAIQVIYATHSPLFTGIGRFDHVRLFRKVPSGNGRPKRTVVQRATLNEVAAELENVMGRPPDTFTGESVEMRLLGLMSPTMNEGFFADCLVLVEGESDQAALMATARLMKQDFEAMGIAVIPVNGKTRLDKPLVIFRRLGIPVFVVFDNDAHLSPKKQKPETNRLLLRLLGVPEEDSTPTTVKETWACFHENIERQLKSEIGEDRYNSELGGLAGQYGYETTADAAKNPGVVEKMLVSLDKQGIRPATLERIVEAILRLREQSAAVLAEESP